jgi:dCTP deaminase
MPKPAPCTRPNNWWRRDDPRIEGGITVSVDLDTADGLIGYRAKRHASVIDVDRPAAYEPLDFWEPIHRRHPMA